MSEPEVCTTADAERKKFIVGPDGSVWVRAAIGDGTSFVDVQTLDSTFDVIGNGIISVGVRRDADTSPVGSDGDAHPFVFDENGLLKVASSINPVPSQNTIEQTKFLLDGTNKNMNQSGTVGTPVVFEFAPDTGEIFQLTTLCFYMGEAGGLAFNKFENISSLTNGLLIEIQSTGTLRTFINAQSNADLGVTFFAGGSTGSKSSWEGQASFGSPTRLNGDDGDFVRHRVFIAFDCHSENFFRNI